MDIQSIKNRFDIIGNDPQLNYAIQVAAQVANTDLSVLIYGESGVGKEIFSQIIHQLSARRHNPFIAVNCGAIPEGTIDSELFGHEKGAFTSASDSRKGYFETVNEGTIFLDEIGEMPLGTQARLLRVLETGEFIRVGSSKVLKTNVRVIAATNKDLLDLTKVGKFREDLYYRLNTVPIKVPALRERQQDIPLLFRKFTNDFAGKYKSHIIRLDDSAQELLSGYTWPGNIRELKNIAEQISVLSKDQFVSAAELKKFLPGIQHKNLSGSLPMVTHQESYQTQVAERELLFKIIFDLKHDMNELKMMLFNLSNGKKLDKEVSNLPATFALPPAEINKPFDTPAISDYNHAHQEVLIQNPLTINDEVEESLSLEDMEKKYIEKALIKHKGKRKDAALELGISDRTLYRKIKEYDLE